MKIGDEARDLPTVVIGAGPVGLAAAARLVAERRPFVLLEAGPRVGHAVRHWGHVRLFTPWAYLVDAAARELLEANGWRMPREDAVPTGSELVERYLQPLAEVPEIASRLRLETPVTGVHRRGVDKAKSTGRDRAPFVVTTSARNAPRILAGAVIDASGTYDAPNPMGAGGVPAPGEEEGRARIFYGIPDATGADRARYAGKRVGVVGSGHSAFNTLLDLDRLTGGDEAEVTWFVRSHDVSRLWGGGDADALSERGALGQRMRALAETGRVRLRSGFSVDEVVSTPDGMRLKAVSGETGPLLDEIVVVTGFRPDLTMTRELRLDLDPIVEAPSRLAPLIDPNLHSCGTVPPHGHRELAHPEPGYYTVGMKSYGRAPTFLLLTGYEQVRSVVKAIVGDLDAADRVDLCLPETGVCNTDFALVGAAAAGAEVAGCCG